MILVVFALPFEEGGFSKRHRSERVEYFIGNATGKRFGDLLEPRIESVNPEAVILAGFAGALTDQWRIGDIAIGKNNTEPTVNHDKKSFIHKHSVPVATVDRALTTRRQKQACAEATGAAICSMEDAHAASICCKRGIPLLSVRCISDRLGDELPLPSDILTPQDGSPPSTLRILSHISLRPMLWRPFLTMAIHAQRARTALHAALHSIVEETLSALH